MFVLPNQNESRLKNLNLELIYLKTQHIKTNLKYDCSFTHL